MSNISSVKQMPAGRSPQRVSVMDTLPVVIAVSVALLVEGQYRVNAGPLVRVSCLLNQKT